MILGKTCSFFFDQILEPTLLNIQMELSLAIILDGLCQSVSPSTVNKENPLTFSFEDTVIPNLAI